MLNGPSGPDSDCLILRPDRTMDRFQIATWCEISSRTTPRIDPKPHEQLSLKSTPKNSHLCWIVHPEFRWNRPDVYYMPKTQRSSLKSTEESTQHRRIHYRNTKLQPNIITWLDPSVQQSGLDHLRTLFRADANRLRKLFHFDWWSVVLDWFYHVLKKRGVLSFFQRGSPQNDIL